MRPCSLLFACIIAVGQAIFAFGITIKKYPISLIGRVVIGVGGENLIVSETCMITGWFSGSEIGMAMGIFISTSRLIGVINYIIQPIIVTSTSLVIGLWVGFALCVLSIVLVAIRNVIDKKKDTLLGIKDRIYLPSSEKIKLSDMADFGFLFWVLCINCLAFYTQIICFTNIASNYFQARFHFTTVESGKIISIMYLTAAITGPCIGMLVDRIGMRINFIIFSNVIATIAHILFLLSPDVHRLVPPIFFMALLGIGYSTYASVMWSSIPHFIEKKCIGTAFGVAASMLNLGLAIGPLVIGYIHETTSKGLGYYWVSFFFVCVGCFGVLTSLVLYLDDRMTRIILNSKDPILTRQRFDEFSYKRFKSY